LPIFARLAALTRRRRSAVAAAIFLALVSACSPSQLPSQDTQVASPPPGLDYVPPAPGTYHLPVIQRAVDGSVLDADGTEHRLFDYLGDRNVLLGFIYLNCSDAKGCPLANASFFMLREDLEADPQLAQDVRLISLSFDPDRDTPQAMLQHLGRDYLARPRKDRLWALLTTSSRSDLNPILDGFSQYIVREVDGSGRETGNLSHVLKVFLIDRELNVRNVYSSSYLHPAIVINDLKTLKLEEVGKG